MKFLPLQSQAERDAALEFRYNPKSRNPATGLHTLHVWSSAMQTRCVCGRFNRNDIRLKAVTHAEIPAFTGLLCGRCAWSDPTLARRLQNTSTKESTP